METKYKEGADIGPTYRDGIAFTVSATMLGTALIGTFFGMPVNIVTTCMPAIAAAGIGAAAIAVSKIRGTNMYEVDTRAEAVDWWGKSITKSTPQWKMREDWNQNYRSMFEAVARSTAEPGVSLDPAYVITKWLADDENARRSLLEVINVGGKTHTIILQQTPDLKRWGVYVKVTSGEGTEGREEFMDVFYDALNTFLDEVEALFEQEG